VTRAIEYDVLPTCLRHRTGVLTYSPLASINLACSAPGLDDQHGHFVAAYGIETDTEESASLALKASNAQTTRSRSSN